MVPNFNLKNGFYLNRFPERDPLNSFTYKMEKQKYDKILDQRALTEIHVSMILDIILKI